MDDLIIKVITMSFSITRKTIPSENEFTEFLLDTIKSSVFPVFGERSISPTIKQMKYYISNGADVNYSNGSPLKMAIIKDNPFIIDFLISNGAKVNDLNWCPLRYAVHLCSIKSVKKFIELNVEPFKDGYESSIAELTLKSIKDFTLRETMCGIWNIDIEKTKKFMLKYNDEKIKEKTCEKLMNRLKISFMMAKYLSKERLKRRRETSGEPPAKRTKT